MSNFCDMKRQQQDKISHNGNSRLSVILTVSSRKTPYLPYDIVTF